MNELEFTLMTPGRMVLLAPRAVRVELTRLAQFEMREGVSSKVLRLLGLGEKRPKPKAFRSAAGTSKAQGYELVGDVAIIPVYGCLTPDGYYDWWSETQVGGYSGIKQAIHAARKDDSVGKIMLRINSPGGLVHGLFDLVDFIREASARHGGKPIWAHCRDALSAAYAIASSCDRIVGEREGEVGSIGCVILHVDESAAHEKWGLKIEAIESADAKTNGFSFKPLSDEARDDMQAIVDEGARHFIEAVHQGRGLSVEAIQAQRARHFLSQHSDATRSGLALGLVDAIGSLESTLEELAAVGSALTINPAAPVAKSMEKKMSVKALNKIRAIAANEEDAEDKLERIQDILDEEDENTNPDDENSGADSEDDNFASAEEDDDVSAEEEDEDKSQARTAKAKMDKTAKATGRYDGFAVFDLPSAKGKPNAFVNNIARRVASRDITLSVADSILQAAPNNSRLGEAMASRDANPGHSGGSKSGNPLAAAAHALAKKSQR